MIGQTIGEAMAGGIQQASLNRRVNRVMERAGYTGETGDTQVSRLAVRAMLGRGTDEQVLEIISRDDWRASLTRLDGTQAGGLSLDGAADRAAAFANSPADDLALDDADTIVVTARRNGPSGRSILADSIGGSMELADSFATLYQENQLLAEIGFVGVSVVLGGPTKTILRRVVGEAGDGLVERGADAFGGLVRGVVTNLATRHKWTIALSIAGYATEADASTIGMGAGVLGSTAVEIGLGAGARQVVDRIKDLRRPYIRRPVRAEIEAVAPRAPDGRPIDPNTLEPIDGTPDLGHRPGHEFWREREAAQAEGLSQAEFNDRMNDPNLYQLEDPSSNRSRRHEQRR